MINLKSKKVFQLLFVCSCILTSKSSFASTYYIDATNGIDKNAGTSATTAWKTLAHVNSTQFKPGDQILFKKGQVWREQLSVSSSGISGNPILFGAYGDGPLPIISAADLRAWTHENGSVWSAPQAADPRLVIFADTYGTNVASPGAMNAANNWYWDSVAKKVYIYSLTDPSPTVQVPVRSCPIFTNAKAYLTFQDLSWRGSISGGGFQGVGGSNFVTIQHCVAELNAEDGICFGTLGPAIDNGLVVNSICRNNGGSGILISGVVHNWTIRTNTVHNNSLILYGSNLSSAGIKVWGNRENGNGSIIEGNISYSNGIAGIWSDETVGVTLRYNLIYLNNGSGLLLEKTLTNSAYYNICYNNANTIYTANIHVDANSTGDSNGNTIYNNTSYGGYWGIKANNWQGDGKNYFLNNIFKNNIAIGATTGQQLYVTVGADNTGGLGSGNVYEFNCFGAESAGFIQWGNTSMSSYNAWEISYGRPTHSIKFDPKFIDVSLNDFKLRNDSLCIDTGANVGLTRDYSGNSILNSPDIGAYEMTAIISSPTNLSIN